jgi:hypothetical protein
MENSQPTEEKEKEPPSPSEYLNFELSEDDFVPLLSPDTTFSPSFLFDQKDELSPKIISKESRMTIENNFYHLDETGQFEVFNIIAELEPDSVHFEQVLFKKKIKKLRMT